MMLTTALACAFAGLVQPEPESPPSSPIRMLWHFPLKSVSFGSAAIANANGDGGADVAFGTYFGDSRVYAVRGRDGSDVWQFNAGNACLDASCRFFDLDGDGKLELVVPVSNTSTVIAFDSANGRER